MPPGTVRRFPLGPVAWHASAVRRLPARPRGLRINAPLRRHLPVRAQPRPIRRFPPDESRQLERSLFVDKRASIYALKALTKILPGRLAARRRAVHPGRQIPRRRAGADTYQTKTRRGCSRFPSIIDGAVTPIRASDREKDTVITNSEYWIAPEITVAKADKSKLRAFGRNWNFAGRSAEICKLDWRGP